MEANSRIELLLEALLNGTEPSQEPMSRVEAYLYALCTKSLSGSDGLTIKSIKQTTTSTADGGTNVITITLSDDSTQTFEIKNGSKGSAGANGTAGKDGVGIKSIKQTTTSTADGGVNVITMTLSDNSTQTFEIRNGSKGSTGDTGENGTTYVLTEQDKQDIANIVLESMNSGTETT